MNIEIYKISDVLADENHPEHADTKAFMEDLRTGKLGLCACIGPVYGEPYCPCEMDRKGLGEQMKNNPLRIADNKQLDEWMVEWLDGMMDDNPLTVVENLKQEIADLKEKAQEAYDEGYGVGNSVGYCQGLMGED